MSGSVYDNRIHHLRQLISQREIDTAWILQPENRRYLSGFQAADPQINESAGSLLINQDRVLVTDSRYVIEAEAQAGDFRVQTIRKGFEEDFPPMVAGLGARCLGFEEEYITWASHERLSKRFRQFSPPIEMKPLGGAVEDMREIKDAAEAEALVRSAALISSVLSETISWIRPGRTEKEVAWRIEALAREAGAEGLAFPSIVASGPQAALPHAVPTDRELRKGEAVILDVGARVDGYCSDMTRTLFLGNPEPRFREVYRVVRRAQLAALKEVRPGIESNYPDSVARKIIGEAGFGEYFAHSLGHGVGLAAHERPRLSPFKPVKLKQGMVVTVEPGIYIPGEGGVRLEETVLIEAEGPRVLTTNSDFYDFS